MIDNFFNEPKWDLHDDPFYHLRIKEFFQPDLYEGIQRHMPPLDVCHELRHRDAIINGKSTRLQFGFSIREMATLPPDAITFWTYLIAGLTSKDTTEMVRESLKDGLTVKHGAKWKDVKLRPTPWLIHDAGGYRITPHPDIPQKAITLQIYLPTDDSQERLGTSLYRKEGDKFKEVHRVPFLPNSGYAFAVTENSWHGVEQVPQGAGCRNSLMVIYYL